MKSTEEIRPITVDYRTEEYTLTGTVLRIVHSKSASTHTQNISKEALHARAPKIAAPAVQSSDSHP